METIISHLTEELFVALLPPISSDRQHASSVYSEQSTNGVELGGENLQDDEREGELRQRRSYISSLEGALSGSNLDKLIIRQIDRASPVHAQPKLIFGMP